MTPHDAIVALTQRIAASIIGQEQVIERLLIALLADEINRAPAKVQAALLEAMEERQVTVAGQTYKLPPCFWCWPHKIPSSRRALIHYPRRRWTAC